MLGRAIALYSAELNGLLVGSLDAELFKSAPNDCYIQQPNHEPAKSKHESNSFVMLF